MTDYNQEQWTVTEGADVVGSDGEKVGEVVNANPDYIVVKKGFFFPNDYYVPSSAISSVDEGHVYLNVTKEEAMNQDPSWENEPISSTTTGLTTDTDVTTSTTSTGLGGYTADVDDRETVTTSSTGYAQDLDTARTDVESDDNVRVSLAEEELSATTREVERGSVGVTKNVVSEEQTLEVPVTEERVNVERRVVDRDVQAGDTVFEEGTIEVPIKGEEVEVHKDARVTEEVRIDKEDVQRTERVGGTVRREEVQIDDTTGVTNTTRGADTVDTTVTETTSTDGDDRGLLDKAQDALDGDDQGTNRKNRGGGNPI